MTKRKAKSELLVEIHKINPELSGLEIVNFYGNAKKGALNRKIVAKQLQFNINQYVQVCLNFNLSTVAKGSQAVNNAIYAYAKEVLGQVVQAALNKENIGSMISHTMTLTDNNINLDNLDTIKVATYPKVAGAAIKASAPYAIAGFACLLAPAIATSLGILSVQGIVTNAWVATKVALALSNPIMTAAAAALLLLAGTALLVKGHRVGRQVEVKARSQGFFNGAQIRSVATDLNKRVVQPSASNAERTNDTTSYDFSKVKFV